MSKHFDIQALVKHWAWDSFIHFNKERKIKKLLEKKSISMEPNWKEVIFIHDPPVYTPPMKPGFGTPTSNVLFRTSFTNKTDDPQSYSFRTERTTKTSCEVQIEDCFTQGTEMSVTMKTPCEIFEANVGYSREMQLTRSEGECIEHELTWEVDNSLQVKGQHRAEAKLVIQEEEFKGGFEIKSTIRGRVCAVFTNLKDNNSFITSVERDIYEIVREAREEGRVKGDSMVVDASSRSVICRTKGKCTFRYGLKQDVEVEQFPLENDK